MNEKELKNLRDRVISQSETLKESRMSLQEWLDAIRLPKKDLALLLGVNRTHIYHLAKGSRNPSDKTFAKIMFLSASRIKEKKDVRKKG